MISDCRFQLWHITYLLRAGGVDCHLRFEELEAPHLPAWATLSLW
jgi:hypothetical protein